jgi:hypothetical protein
MFTRTPHGCQWLAAAEGRRGLANISMTATSITLALMNGPSTRADARRNRQALLEAGAGALAECGVDVQVSEIVRRAGLAKQTFFRHFPSKDALIVAILVENVNRHTDTARTFWRTAGTTSWSSS